MHRALLVGTSCCSPRMLVGLNSLDSAVLRYLQLYRSTINKGRVQSPGPGKTCEALGVQPVTDLAKAWQLPGTDLEQRGKSLGRTWKRLLIA